jgi:predicted SAM-dependent methyltransferase
VAAVSERARLLAYLDRLEATRDADRRVDAGTPLPRKIGKHLLPARSRVRARLAATRLVRPRERRRARELAARAPLKLHLGSGVEYKPGWVNVDLLGDRVDLAWDLTTPLPFPDGVAEAVFIEHVLTVIDLRNGLAVFDECFRLLGPGGIVRVGVPDPWPTRSAISQGDDLPRLLAVQEIFYYPGNRAMYDAETLELALRAAGFRQTEQRDFGDSRIAACPDTPRRREGTLYVEAVR